MLDFLAIPSRVRIQWLGRFSLDKKGNFLTESFNQTDKMYIGITQVALRLSAVSEIIINSPKVHKSIYCDAHALRALVDQSNRVNFLCVTA